MSEQRRPAGLLREPRSGFAARRISRFSLGKAGAAKQDGLSKGEIVSKRELIDIAGELRGETDKASRIYDGKTTEWVPKSMVEENSDGTFTMPEWLAQDKGFI
jgi:hypothetical protein